MIGALGLTARIDHPPRERPLARVPAAQYRRARRGTAVGVPALSSLSGDSQRIFYYKNYFM